MGTGRNARCPEEPLVRRHNNELKKLLVDFHLKIRVVHVNLREELTIG